jgi:two-component system, cell cycle sensor histidine kinase and response regulator CckA
MPKNWRPWAGWRGGVAHDFNNILTAIMGYTEIMLGGLHPGDPLRLQLEGVSKAVDRAAELTRQLLAFSRKQILQPQVINLNATVNNGQDMLRRLIGEHIELETILEMSLGYVKADVGQIEQIIMNLIVNARDAMPQGGKITIQTANLEFLSPHPCHIETAPPGQYVMLAVTDTGLGMDGRTQIHLFEPFYTTKEIGKGTGLGLSSVYGSIKQSEGFIEVQTGPGSGTTFKIYLPRVKGSISAPQTAPTRQLRGSETILVVEDEDMVRQFVVDALRMYGYNALVASNGGEALLICEQYTDPIHLMLTDVVMPKMSGPELAERLAPLHPEMKVLYMSGYTEKAIEPKKFAETGSWFIQKPFTATGLLQKVRKLMETSDQVFFPD